MHNQLDQRKFGKLNTIDSVKVCATESSDAFVAYS